MNKIYLTILLAFSLFTTNIIHAQNAKLEVQIIAAERSGASDCFGCGDPDPAWVIRGYLGGVLQGTTTLTFEEMGGTVWNIGYNGCSGPTPCSIINTSSTSETQFVLGLDAWENDCNPMNVYNSCTFNSDFRRCNNQTLNTINYRISSAYCIATNTSGWTEAWSDWCGNFRVKYAYRWSFASAPIINTQPVVNTTLCIGATTTLSAIANIDPSSGLSLGRFYQWQISENTDCAGATAWQDIPGANAVSFIPPQISGTRLYRVKITSNCTNDFTSLTTISNCSRVTYMPYNGTTTAPIGFPYRNGDNAPAIQSSICGSTVLPGSNYSLSTLQPPAVDAMANNTAYTWSASGGSLSTTSGASVIWTSPTLAGTYNVTVVYNDACITADASSVCTITVGASSCDFIYVSPTGTDVVGGGGPLNPYRTIAFAIANMSGKLHMKIKNGVYLESSILNIPANIIIEGGYNESGGVWTKSSNSTTNITCSATQTIDANIAHVVGFSSSSNNWKLIDLNISTINATGSSSSGNGLSNYALYLNTCSGYEIIRCNITSGSASSGIIGIAGASGIAGSTGGNGGGSSCDGNNPGAGGGNGGNGGSGISGGAGGGGIGVNGSNGAGRNGGGGGGGGQGGNFGNNSGRASGNGGAGSGIVSGGVSGGGGGGGGNPGSAGANGSNGSNGSSGVSGTIGISAIVGGYFQPGRGTAGTDGQGGGGARGGGGGGGQGCFFCDDGPGNGGGGGGGGGQGGAAGQGGGGGGSSYAIFLVNNGITSAIRNSSLNAGAFGNGANGGSGGSAGAGGSGGIGGSVCTSEVGRGGNGGTGGNGGNGGNGGAGIAGQQFALGTNGSGVLPILPAGITANVSINGGSIPLVPINTITYNNNKLCKNSVINLSKTSGNWDLTGFGTGFSFVNDLNNSSSSYNNTSALAQVYTNTAIQDANVKIDATIWDSYLQIANDNRPAPILNSSTDTFCLGFNTIISHTNSYGTELEYDWRIYSGLTTTGTLVYTNTSNNSITTPFFTNPGTYLVKYQVREQCCSWSIPAYKTIYVRDTAKAPITILGIDSICIGNSTTLSISGGVINSWDAVRWYSSSCGGTFIGSGNSIVVSPTVNTTYYVRVEGLCNITNCISKQIFVIGNSTPPSQIAGNSPICNGEISTMFITDGNLAVGANWHWYKDSCNGISIGSGTFLDVTPSSTTTYYIRAEGICDTTICRSFTVIVNSLSSPIAGISGINTICLGNSTTLTRIGGTLGTGAQVNWYTGFCGGTYIGTGDSITVFPTSNTDYYARIEGICDTTICQSKSIIVQDTSIIADSIIGNKLICSGTSTLLSISGGHLGVGASWNWYTGSCGGTIVNSGSIFNTGSLTTTTTYYVRAEGDCNNTICIPVTVIVNPLPNGSINGSTTICPGASTYLVFNFSAGTNPYNVQYSDGINTFNLSNVRNGDSINVHPTNTTTYTFTSITDSNGCFRNSSFIGGALITVAPSVTITSVTSTNISCFGATNGVISIAISGGAFPISYSIDSGINLSLSNVFTNLDTGIYNIYVRDFNGCYNYYATNPITITQPTQLTASASVINASCGGIYDGQINVVATGGVAPYNYSLNGGAYQPGTNFSGLSAGNYLIQVQDFNSCTDTLTVSINNSYVLQDTLVSKTNVSCYGLNNGSFTVNAFGGISPYSYSLDGIIYSSTNVFTGLSAGNYNVFARDSRGCQNILNITITSPPNINLSIDSVINGLCNGGNTGAIYTSTNGGTSPYTFLWSNGSINDDITGLPAGNYSITVTDFNSCTSTISQTIATPAAIFLNVAGTQNVLCNGGSTAFIDITTNGGTPPYSYLWSNASIIEDQINIPAGNYSVTVTDGNGCTRNITQNISEPNILSLTSIITNVLCYSSSSGNIDITILGGTAPYTYLWSNGSTTQDLTGVTAGNYTVIVSDANGCSINSSYTITEPSRLSVNSITTNLSCYNSNDGSINLNISGGRIPYTYLWNDASNLEDRISLSVGNYAVIITDSNGCLDSFSTVISQPDSFIISTSQTNVSCAGRADAIINLTVNGGTLPYSYLWSDGSTSEDRIAIAGGLISVTITDAHSCSRVINFNIIESAPIVTTTTFINPSCYGGNNGSIDLTTTGGTLPYNFLWNTFENTEDISSLNAGLYTVIVTDANGCSNRDTIRLSQPSQIAVSHISTNVLCYGFNTGSIDLTISGGIAPYTYLWNDGDTNEDRNALYAGTYTVTVIDANLCSTSYTVLINSPLTINIIGIITNARCNGAATGSIDIAVSGGIGGYSYDWGSGITTEDRSFISAGTYIITVTDANSCTASQTFIVTEPPILNASINTHNVTCFNGNDGSARIIATGGTAPYNYFWSSFILGDSIFNQRSGVYSALVTDFNGCQIIASTTITSPSIIQPNFNIIQPRCYGGTNGSVSTSTTGGTAPYTYLWSTGSTNSFINFITAGTYYLTITDFVGCTKLDSVVVDNPTPISITGILTNLTCHNNSSGAIDITISGGTPGYGIGWTLPDGNNSNLEDISNGMAGIYTIVVNDIYNCTAYDTFELTEPDTILVSSLIDSISCNNSSNGRIDIDVNGGTSPYTYLWSTSSINEDLNALTGGTYTVTITDANNCSSINSYILNNPLPISLVLVPINPTCFGVNNGSINTVASGGTQPYTYNWSNFENSDNIDSLIAGTYFVTVSDANLCTTTANITLVNPLAITVSALSNDLSCYNNNTGSIDLSILSGGIGTLNYSWSNGALTQDIIGLNSGNYEVTVTDANNCSTIASFTISQPDSMFSNMSAVSPNCNGGNTGFAEIDVFGGTPAYTYSWNSSPIQTTNIASGLSAGTYIVAVTDQNGCLLVDSVTITSNNPLTILVDSINTTCYNSTNGSIVINASGGQPPYNYILNGISQTNNVFNNLSSGSYSVEVIDLNGCSVFKTINITAPNGFYLFLDASDRTISRGDVVTLTARDSNSTTPIINYEWTPLSDIICISSPVCNTVTSVPIETTLYTVTAMNADSCLASDTITINVRQDKAVFIPSVFSPNGDGKNETFDFQILGAENVFVSIWNRFGQNIYTNPNQKNGIGQGWDGTFKGEYVPLETYTYQFEVTYYDGTKRTLSGSVTVLK